MQAIDFVVRGRAGTVQRSTVTGEAGNSEIYLGSDQQVSLNLSQHQVASYQRAGSDLQIILADGRTITLVDYFGDAGNRLFISADGAINEVTFVDGGNGVLFADYGAGETWGKWSPSQDLVFYEEANPIGIAQAPVAATYGEETVSMLGAGMLLAPSLLGTGVATAGAVIGGAALIGAVAGGGGNGEGGGGAAVVAPAKVPPTVVDKDVTLGGDNLQVEQEVVTITGTGEPGANVEVEIDGNKETTTVDPDGNWTVDFKDETFPTDGNHGVVVTVTDPDGEKTVLPGPDVVIDTTPPTITVTEGTESVNDMFNAASHGNGVTISGSGEPGATVAVTVEGITHTTTVSPEGNWSVDYTTSEIGGGEYSTTATIVTTDGFGNSSAPYTETVIIDTVTTAGIDGGLSQGDNVVNNSEATSAGGVAVTGTAEPGASLVVSVGGQNYSTTAKPDGTWSITIPQGNLAGGTYDIPMTVTSTDGAGNTATATGSLHVDTEGSVAVVTDKVGVDGTLNDVERDATTFQLTGTTEPGSTVMVTVGGVTVQAVVATDGTWTATVPTAALPSIENMETDIPVIATATDAYGNVSQSSGLIDVDTYVNQLSGNDMVAGADHVANSSELANGLVLGGQVEAGSKVNVFFNGESYAATVATDGSWTVTIPTSDFPSDEFTANYTVQAIDEAGNQRQVNNSVVIDMLAPEGPTIFEEGTRILENSNGEDGTILTRLFVRDTGDEVDLVSIDADGTVYEPVQMDVSIDAGFSASGQDEIEIRIGSSERILDGSMLVVNAEDTSGNTSGTLLAWDQSASLEIDMDAVNAANLNIEKIDLRLAKEADITLTEEQVLDLSDTQNSVTIFGGSDDSVTILGAQKVGNTTDSDGNNFDVYSMGNEAVLYIDEHIDNVTI